MIIFHKMIINFVNGLDSHLLPSLAPTHESHADSGVEAWYLFGDVNLACTDTTINQRFRNSKTELKSSNSVFHYYSEETPNMQRL